MASLSDSEDADIDQTTMLTGFLFGNINESGQLEDDFFDEESRNRIGKLASFCAEGLVKELAEDGENVDNIGDRDEDAEDAARGGDNYDDADETIAKHESAIDFSDINEVADLDENDSYATDETSIPINSGDPPTSIVNGTVAPMDDNYDNDEAEGGNGVLTLAATETDVGESSGTLVTCDPPIKPMMQTPLASMIPPGLMNKDVREWFPEFKNGKVLRFNRLFKPAHNLNIWKKKKKKKPQEAEKKPTEPVRRESTPPSLSSSIGNDNDEYYFIQQMRKLARSPTLEELDVDDLELLLRPETAPSMEFDNGGQNIPAAAIWRHGPSRLWYDMLGVPEDGKGFSYGFKLKQVSYDWFIGGTIACLQSHY